MPPLAIAASSRGEFRPADKLMRFTRPGGAVVGDQLLVIVWSHGGESLTLPAGWQDTGPDFPGAYRIWTFTRALMNGDPAVLDIALQPAGSVAHEWQGVLVVVRGGYPDMIEFGTGNAFFAQQPVTTIPVGGVEQATSLALGVFVAAGTNIIRPNLDDNTSAYTTLAIDSFASGILEKQTAAVACRVCGETATVRFSDAAVDAPVTGFVYFYVLHAGRPATPAELYDVVPGNLGLLAKDTRPGAQGFGAEAVVSGVVGNVGGH